MTLPYKLSLDAERDLRDIARYTHINWGKKIFHQYRNGLKPNLRTLLI